MLLVSLSHPGPFFLQVERAPKYYGFSADTAQRGFRELVDVGIIRRQRVRKVAPLAPEGYTFENRYSLLPPFDRLQGDPETAPEADS